MSDNLKPIYSLSICGRLTLELHSLNNEGGEGNQTMTRTVAVVDTAGNVHKVNAISGDMFKHIQAEHFYLLARENKMPLCKGCETFRADRILGDAEFLKDLPDTDSAAITNLLKKCALEDTEGTLIARGARSIPRKSVAEFSWVVGLPDKVRTESYFHVRYAQERGGEDVSQPIFHRPASSGVYASVANFELARIGFNDVSQTYAIADDERLRRHQTFLRSVLYTYVEPAGAMRNTQNPHILNFEGVVTASYGVLPAPTISPLADDYKEQVQAVARALDGDGKLEVHTFANTAEFAAVMQKIIQETKPYQLFAQGG
ncbi:DevR family CRISPR-associated autoregulator [Roseiflexus castenholzii]|uniref:CRISPR-associated autoregulator, DevR family n=1 Tax=Roseiflexus castenholzii (strain DSM 13941 / HLO8) TaxID=383372 RepID=A7NI20_ROSCS|nr:DevR family CRISPR-associated autoregulator [Roseiflexus castenholzii]ABU57120.1 CRISPR-associated autoregulator, DevR family [Roseiflexus castenholzii DSM 13941]